MKIKLGIFFISALVLASGCARKCPPCSTGVATGSYGTSASYSAPQYSAPAPAVASSYSAPAASTTSSNYDSGSGRYVSK